MHKNENKTRYKEMLNKLLSNYFAKSYFKNVLNVLPVRSLKRALKIVCYILGPEKPTKSHELGGSNLHADFKNTGETAHAIKGMYI